MAQMIASRTAEALASLIGRATKDGESMGGGLIVAFALVLASPLIWVLVVPAGIEGVISGFNWDH